MLFGSKDILLVTLGGTIESHYNPEEGTPYTVPAELPGIIPQAMQQLGLACRVKHVPICHKDSKYISLADLYRTVSAIAEHHPYKKVMLVQGTDTMARNADKIQHMLHARGVADKTLVFTGAMEPLRDKYSMFRKSADGWQNLREAVDAADHQPPGSYIVMGGQCIPAHMLKKFVVTDETGRVLRSGFAPRTCRSTRNAAMSHENI